MDTGMLKKLGTTLVEMGVLSVKDLNFCLDIQKASHKREKLGYVLKQYNMANEKDVALALAKQVGWAFYNGDYSPDIKLVELVGIEFIKKNFVFPVLSEDQVPTVVLVNVWESTPKDIIDAICRNVRVQVRFCVGIESRVAFAIEHLIKESNRSEHLKTAGMMAEENSEDKVVQTMLEHAVSVEATDIHIEASKMAVEIRERIDGVLHFYKAFPVKMLARITNIFFHKAEVGTSEFQKFHDARFDYEHLGHRVDVRLSHIPAIHGSSLVLRLQDKNKTSVSLEYLGYAGPHWEIIQQALKCPNGIILMTGPTGCGKTTSLYAMLNACKSIGTKIISIEDPVEVEMPLIVQIQIDSKKGHTFATVTRSILRHDPDIILIGEIRDLETAKIAAQASMTGHKVFSTLHTNDPVSAVLRLKDLGIDNATIAGSLRCVISQRLIRKLCPVCKNKKVIKRESLDSFQAKYLLNEEQEVFDAVGCNQCVDGYRGRTVVAEVLYFDSKICYLIEQGMINEIAQYIAASGKKSFRIQDDAARLIKAGVVDLVEAVRVLG